MIRRCDWARDVPPLYQEYHDTEWGRPLRGDRELFERIALEGFQAGLSWWSVLSRRDALRAAFDQFDPHVIAQWDESRTDALMQEPSIIRNRAKIRAVFVNAQVVSRLEPGLLTELIWSFAPPSAPVRQTMSDLPAVTEESTAMARALKGLGLTFLGPTTCYALMQACGVVNDHVASCEYR